MLKTAFKKSKELLLFLTGAVIMVVGYSKGADNIRSLTRTVSDHEKENTGVGDAEVVLEDDFPEISSGTQ